MALSRQMKSSAHQLLVIDAQIAALRFLRSGAASAELAAEAVRRERDLGKERERVVELERRQASLEIPPQTEAA